MPIDLELLQKIERQRQRLEDGVRPALIEGLVSPAKKEASFAATTPPSSQELSSSFVTSSSRSSSPELGRDPGSYRLTEGRCEALSIPWPLDLEDEAKTTDVEDDFPWMHCLWGEPSEASLAATAQICLGAAPERCPSRDLSPVDETKVMAWRPKSRTKKSPKGSQLRGLAKHQVFPPGPQHQLRRRLGQRGHRRRNLMLRLRRCLQLVILEALLIPPLLEKTAQNYSCDA